MKQTASIIALLALGLLLTGALATTAYAAPLVAGLNGGQNMDQTQSQQRLGDCSGEMLQNQERLRDGSCSTGDCEGNQIQSQSQLGEQAGNCIQNCFRNGQ